MDAIYKIFVTTDDMGRFFASQELGESIPSGASASIRISVVEPEGVLVEGVADVENDSASSDNLARNFEVSHGQACDLGNWVLGGGDKLKLFGGVGESRPNLMLALQIVISAAEGAAQD
ncbi:hypothetical protein IT575_07590 [bacterium]|nr:hypothetical protein [bacterium]